MWKTKTTAPSTSYLSPKHQTSEINIRRGNTSMNDPEFLVKSRGSRSRTAPLFRHKGLRMMETHFSSDGYYRCATS